MHKFFLKLFLTLFYFLNFTPTSPERVPPTTKTPNSAPAATFIFI